jgi:hypothetical protein
LRAHPYHFEQLDLLSSFVSAFDDAFVYRYDAITREQKERIDVRYVLGPKHRVLHDLNDKAKNLTLPVVTIEQTNLVRNANRILHKGQHFFRPSTGSPENKIAKIPVPVPVDIDVSVSIIGKFKEDIDQIIQNFIVYCDPYIIVPLQIPAEFGVDFVDEIRVEIQWDGNISYTNPKDLSPDTKWRITADTTFKIKGWLFKEQVDKQAPIYVVKNDFRSINLQDRLFSYNDYSSLSGDIYSTEVISISAYPEFTNIFYNLSGTTIPVLNSITILQENPLNILLLGKRFDYSNTWYLSGDVISPYSYSEIVTAKYPTISAYKLPLSTFNVSNDNIANINIPANILSGGNFTFVTSNSAGWVSTGVSFTVD